MDNPSPTEATPEAAPEATPEAVPSVTVVGSQPTPKKTRQPEAKPEAVTPSKEDAKRGFTIRTF